jgi:hypothetical protein
MVSCMHACACEECACEECMYIHRWRDGYRLEHDHSIHINTYGDMHKHVFMYEHARTASLRAASAPSDSSFATMLSSPLLLA